MGETIRPNPRNRLVIMISNYFKPLSLFILLSHSTLLQAQQTTSEESNTLAQIVQQAPTSEETHQALIKATQHPDTKIQQSSWLLFKGIQSEATNQHLASAVLNLTDRSQDHPAAIEIIEVAKTFLNPEVKGALNQYLNSQNKSEPLTKWLPALSGGDPHIGAELFKNHSPANCASCHSVNPNNNTNLSGPNLSGIATRVNHLRKDLLEMLVLPDASIADGYGNVTVTFDQGQVTGTLLSYASSGIIVQLKDTPRLISYTDVRELSFAKSAMSPIDGQLTLREARDLIAYLDTLTVDPNAPEDQPINATPFSLSEVDTSSPPAEVSLEEKQQRLYNQNCMACHQQHGEGSQTFPPLAKSEWVSGDKDTLIKIQLLGLTGPIEVRNKIYDGIAMPSNARLSNEDIAHILTYIRTTPSWGNNSTPVTADEVAKVREELEDINTPLDAKTLTHPHSEKITRRLSKAPITVKGNLSNDSTPYLIYLIIFILICLIPVAISFKKNREH